MKVVNRVVTLVLCLTMCFMPIGCSAADIQKAVSLVAAEIPTALSLAEAVLAVVGAAQGGTGSPLFAVPTDKINALKALCDSYTAHPDKNVYKQVVSLVDDLVTNGDQNLLVAASIKDSATQSKVTATLGALDAVLHIIDGYVQATQSVSQVQAVAKNRAVKLKQVSMYWPAEQKKQMESAFHQPYSGLYEREVSLGF